MKGKAWLSLLVLLVALAIAGTLDYQDRQAVEEFCTEYRVITDSTGKPQVVPVTEGVREVELYFDLMEKSDGHVQKTASK